MKKFFTLKYFALVLVASLGLTALAVFLANDAFALTAPDGEAEIIIPPDCSKSELADTLKENGLIKSKLWFNTYLALRGKSLNVEADTYLVPYGSGFDGIVRILTYGSPDSHVQVRVVIPEGSSIENVMEIICDKYGICERAEFTDAVQNGDFSKYSFVSAPSSNPQGRKYRLEGYLYPDTYCFYSDSSAYTVIDKMLSNFNSKFDKKYLAACEKQGMTVNEAVTLASIIIREGKYVSDYGKISSVFHNRLKSPSFSGRLQSDATLVYALGREMQPEDKELDCPYNTYKYGGLPPSPICSPDLNAISYAIYPDSTRYYYFVTKKDGSVLYAHDYYTHQQNIRKATA